MITKFARLKFELFTKPSKTDFLRVHQSYDGHIFVCIAELTCCPTWSCEKMFRYQRDLL